MIETGYLQELLMCVSAIKENIKYRAMIPDDCVITYLATKRNSFAGMKSGYSEQLFRIEKGLKESKKIRANCKNYLKIYRNTEGMVLQIENYVNGRMDYLFQSHYADGLYYLFPYFSDGSFYPTYSYVTRYTDNKVTEEYMVDGNQIIYESYSNETKMCVDYEYINYVKDGKYPILEKKRGIFRFNPLRYESAESDNWLNDHE